MNSNKLNTIFSETAESIRQKSGRSNLLTPTSFATEVAKLGEVPFSKVAYGTEEPDATKYKYWVSVPTTKEEAPLTFENWCYSEEIVSEVSETGDITLNKVPYDSGTYSYCKGSYLRTKNYVTLLSNDGASHSTYTSSFTFYRIGSTFGNMSFGCTFGRTGYKTLSRSTIFPEGPSSVSHGAVYYITNSLHLDNIVYFIYKTSSSSYTLIKYDLDTDTRENLGTFSETGTGIWFYVHDNGCVYYKTRSKSNNKYVYNVYKLKSSDGVANKINVGSFSSVNDSHSSTMLRLNDNLVLLSPIDMFFNSDSAIGYILNASTNVIITNTSTTNLMEEALRGKTNFNIINSSIDRYASFIINTKDTRNPTLVTVIELSDTVGSSRHSLAIVGYRADINSNELAVDVLLVIEPESDTDYIYYKDEIISYDEKSKELAVICITGEVQVYSSLNRYTSSVSTDIEPCILMINYSGTSHSFPSPEYRYESPCDTSNRVVLATLNCSKDEFMNSRRLHKFYQTSELFTYAAYDEEKLFVPAFYKGKTYRVYFSDGNSWYNEIQEDMVDNMPM